MKKVSLENHIRKLAFGWTVSGILLTLAISGAVFHWLQYRDAERQIETLATSALSAYRKNIFDGGLRSIELQLKKDFSISDGENLIFLDPTKAPWVADLQQRELRRCSDPSLVCRDFWSAKVVIEKPIYFDGVDAGIWGYLHIEKTPSTDWSLIFSVTLAIIIGMLFQNVGFYFNMSNAIKTVSTTLGAWAEKLSLNPKDAANYESAPFVEIEPIGVALAGLRGEISELEGAAREQGALSTLRGVGHDILNPVLRMKRILGLLEMRAATSTGSDDLLTSMSANLKRLSGYAEQLKYIYRQQTGETVGAVPITDLSHEMAALVKELGFDSEARDKNLAVIADVAPGCHAQIPAAAFGRIIENLYGNSVHAANVNSSVSMRVEDVGTSVRVSIEDRGSGISDSDKSKIFRSGFTTKPNTGTGLGLFVVKQICDEYGGTIQLDSKVGRGTRINIEFPKCEVLSDV